MPKVFPCSACNGQHKRPVGSKCQFKSTDSLEVSTSITQSGPNSDNQSQEILMALNSVTSRLSSMEQRMDKTEERPQGRFQQAPSTSSERATVDMVLHQEESDAENDAIIPSAHMLKGSQQIQEAVDQRLKELTTLNEKGRFKSQRGGQEQIFVRRQVPWPQNYILAGTGKNRLSYDSLSIFQWVCGLCNIIRDEKMSRQKIAC